MLKTLFSLCPLLFLLLLNSCDDDQGNTPLIDVSTANGESHRAGENCLQCHNKPNRGTPVYVTAGTVYDRQTPQQPYPGTTINLYSDAAGNDLLESIAVDQSGNFYSSNPIDYNGTIYAEVVSNLGAIMKLNPAPHGDCNKCHDNGNDPKIYALD